MGKTLVKVIIGVVVIGGGLAYLVVNAMQSSWSYYISVDEFTAKHSLAQTNTLRIAGVVGKDSVVNDVEKMTLTFDLRGKDVSLPINYARTMPDNFAEDREVVVEGRLGADGVFQANTLMTKCESKYSAKVREQPSSGAAANGSCPNELISRPDDAIVFRAIALPPK